MVDVVARLLGQAAQAPRAAAVVERSRILSYADFVERAETFAVAFGQVQHPRVLIAIEKGADAYAAMFGALMAAGTYAPVNVASPPARLRQIADIFDPDVVVATPPLATQLFGQSRARLVDPVFLLPARPTRPPATPDPAAIAYVIFTSGSTGAPKGVSIARAALAHYVDWLGPALAIGPGDRLSQHPNIGFDLSVLDIFGALCHGAALHPFVEASARLLPARKVRETGITIWNSVPSVISAMATAGELDAAHLGSVRLFTFCGEVLRRDQVAGLFAACPAATVLNTYGPTEATVAMTCRRLTAATFDELCGRSAPLGAAIGDMRLDLVGESGDGQGEIVVSGPQLASGYWGDPDLTSAKFRDLATPAGTVRAFHTGDFAKRIGGELYFVGRGDDMVKVRGHRIHLGEIGRALDRLGWPEAFVFESDGAIRVVVERDPGRAFDETRLRAAIAVELDSYFVPAAIRCVARFPRTGNDKIDGSALKELFQSR